MLRTRPLCMGHMHYQVSYWGFKMTSRNRALVEVLITMVLKFQFYKKRWGGGPMEAFVKMTQCLPWATAGLEQPLPALTCLISESLLESRQKVNYYLLPLLLLNVLKIVNPENKYVLNSLIYKADKMLYPPGCPLCLLQYIHIPCSWTLKPV